MHFINIRKKNSFSFFSFAGALLFIASLSFATVGSAADSGDNNLQAESNRFAFLQNNPANFFFGSNARQSSFASPLNGQINQADEIVGSEVFEQFEAWVKTYVGNGYRADEEQSARGERLASERQQVLKQLIKVNPKAALDKAITAETFKRLPEYITKYSEKRISATGDFLVYVIEGLNQPRINGEAKFSSSRTERAVIVGETRYKASVYGRRESMTTKLGIPLQGIVIDDVMAVDENPARILDKEARTAEVGGKQVYFSDQAEFDSFVAEQIEWESKIGPVRPKYASGKGNSATEMLAPEQAALWTEGAKTLLVIRVDFSDKPGVPLDFSQQPFTVDRAKTLYSQVNQFFVNNSYNKTSIQTPVVTEVIRLPQTLAFYKEQYTQSFNLDAMKNDARIAARAFNSNHDFNSYDLDVVAFTYTSFPGGVVALSTIGDKGSVLSGDAFYLPEAAHELGHNYGLEHANLWRTTDGKPDGTGYSEEYGDCYDMMSACAAGQNNHFNAQYKRKLNWLTEADVATVTATGTYKTENSTIYAQDAATGGSGKKRAIRINRDGIRNYWIEFRQLIAGNAMNGALIRWDTDGQNPKSQLLDMTPNTSSIGDAPLLVGGQPFRDDTYGIIITVQSKNGSELNVKVETDVAPANCTYSLSPTSVNITGFNQGNTSTFVTTGPNCPWAATSNDNWLTVADGVGRKGPGSVSISALSNSGEERIGTVTVGGQPFSVTQYAGTCTGSIKPTTFIDSNDSTSFSVPASGGNLTYSTGSCNSVTPTSEGTSPWIIINNGSITVLENTGPARSGSLTLQVTDSNGANPTKALNVRQAGRSADCTFSLNPTIRDFNASGGEGFFSVSPINAGCSSTYNAVSSHPWITVSNTSGQAGSNINYTVVQNTTGVSRIGTVTVSIPNAGNRTFTVNQAAAAACTFSISPSSRNFTLTGGTGNFTLTASDLSCAWTAATSDSWINITGGTSGTGNASVNFTVSASNVPARTGTITVGGQVFNISQDSGCVYSLQPSSSAVLNASGANGSFEMQTGSGCNWTVTSNVSWLTINSNSFGSGNGTISYTAAANTGSSARTGTISAGGRTFTVNQAASCAFLLSRTSISFGNSGGSDSVNVTSGAGCTWTAVSNSAWITVTSGSSGNGNGTVTFSATPNTGPARDGTITIAGQTFTVSQASGCTFSLSSPNPNFGEAGGNGSVNVASGTGCTWTAASNVSWITFTGGANGAGNGTITFSVAANMGSARTGTIAIGGQTFAIAQDAVTPTVSINNVSLNEGNSGTTAFNFTVTLSSTSSQAVTVNYSTANGTATAGQDYAGASNGTVTIPAGQLSGTVIVQVIGDTIVENNETFTVNLSTPQGATIAGGQGTATGTIQNDDTGGSLQFSLSSYTVNENAGTAGITVTRTGGAASGVSVNYSTSNGSATAGQDYAAASGTLTFGAGETSKTFVVPITNDSTNEPNETINLTLSNSVSGTLGTPATAVLTIIDDDGAPTLSISNVSANEGNSGTTAFNFTVSLLGTSSQTVTVNYSSANGTATAPSDFQPASSSLSFAPGETVKNITVSVNGDTEVEANETFAVNLSGATNATIANGIGTGTIQNDDAACTYSIAPAFLNTNADAKSGNTFFVTTQAGCAWTATTADSFITINSGASGSGNGTVNFNVAANAGAARTGTILVAGQTFTVNQTTAATAPRKVLFDFDGDGKSDVSVFRPDNGVWYQLNSASGFSAAQFGISTDKIAPADFDGDGKTDFAVFRDGNWFLLRSREGFASIPFGSPGDIPEPADFDGDGRAELAVFRPSNGTWYSLNLVNNAFSAVQFGVSEDKPVTADYDGDGRADQAVYRPSSGTWYMLKSRDGFSAVQFGISTDKPVVGDFDGDGRADQAVYRAEIGTWYILGSRQGFTSTEFGLPSDIPTPGDYDGDGKTDIAVFRPEGGNWYQMKSTQGFGAVQFGARGDKPIPNSLVR